MKKHHVSMRFNKARSGIRMGFNSKHQELTAFHSIPYAADLFRDLGFQQISTHYFMFQ